MANPGALSTLHFQTLHFQTLHFQTRREYLSANEDRLYNDVCNDPANYMLYNITNFCRDQASANARSQPLAKVLVLRTNNFTYLI